jgi:hypothetical protein
MLCSLPITWWFPVWLAVEPWRCKWNVTLVDFHQATLCYILKDKTFHSHHCENLRYNLRNVYDHNLNVQFLKGGKEIYFPLYLDSTWVSHPSMYLLPKFLLGRGVYKIPGIWNWNALLSSAEVKHVWSLISTHFYMVNVVVPRPRDSCTFAICNGSHI